MPKTVQTDRLGKVIKPRATKQPRTKPVKGGLGATYRKPSQVRRSSKRG